QASLQQPNTYLQIWDAGPLTTDPSTSPTVEMALNVRHDFGDILETCWCPFGSTYEDCDHQTPPTTDRLKRLGLLALATEDGLVRLLAVPHPRQLAHSYRRSVLYGSVRPVLTLQ